MEQTEDGLYGRKPYLSEVLDVSAFCRGRANIIVAPCHSGKTTATAKIVEAHAQGPERVLYLIDTAAGKKAMINRKQARPITREWVREIDPAWWTGDPEPGKIRVMSYHQFGYELEKSRSFPLGLDLIICDEMHNLIKYMDIEKARNKEREKDGGAEQNCCRKAFECLCQCAVLERDGPLIVILTATPNSLCQALHKAGRVPFECFVYTSKVHADQTRERIYYADLPALLRTMKERCVVYVSTLSMMDDCAEAVADGQRRICCLWSLHNPREMSEEQRSVLEYHQICVDERGYLGTVGKPVDLVNTREDGTFIQPRSLKHTNHVAHTELNMPLFDFHTLRHTHTTLLLEAGANPLDVQERLVHSQLTITWRYVHNTDAIRRQTNSILSKIFV